jgi:hypothetical protein
MRSKRRCFEKAGKKIKKEKKPRFFVCCQHHNSPKKKIKKKHIFVICNMTSTPDPVMTITNFPRLDDVDIESANDLSFTESDQVLSGAGLQTQLHELSEKTAEQRNKFCRGRPWWDCSESATQNECSFVSGQCVGAPIETEPQRYFQKWLTLYGPIYQDIQPPLMDENGNLLTSKQYAPQHHPHRRKKSVRRERVVF